jgi:carotenoid cleavage dioxygenase
MELDEQWHVVKQSAMQTKTRALLVHDTAFTARWYLTPETGHVALGQALRGKTTVWDAVKHDARGRRMFFVPRDGGRAFTARFPAGAIAFHVANAFDDADEIVADVAIYEDGVDLPGNMPPGHPGRSTQQLGARLHRVRVKPGEETLRIERVCDAYLDSVTVHPGLHGRRHRFVYAPVPTSRGDEDLPRSYTYVHGVGRIDVDTRTLTSWDAGPRVFVAPPVFVPASATVSSEADEAAGHLVVWAHDAAAEKSKVFVLNAADVANGPIATLTIDTPLPLVSHADWSPIPIA